MDYRDEIGHLLQMYFSGIITPDDRCRLERWLGEKEEHRLLLEKLRKDTRFADEYGLFREVDAERAWEAFRVKNGLVRQRRIRVWTKYVAAAIVLPLVVTGVWLLLSQEVKNENIPVVQCVESGGRDVILEVGDRKKVILAGEREKVIHVGKGIAVRQNAGELVYTDSVCPEEVDTNVLRIPRGKEFTLQLADGTRVYLNSATELRYPVVFTGENRQVYLKGEAYFEVAKDTEHPFFVLTDDVQIKVYGTSFNVNTRPRDGIRTVLVEGKVGVKGGVSDEECMLKPNEMAFYDRFSREIKVEKVDPDLYTLWRKGIFVFERESLENIMETLSAWYDVEICFQSESVRRLHFSGHMKRYERIEDILHAITDATGVTFTISGKTVYVSK